MKFSENWLRELVPINATRDELCRKLTMAGLEVEGVEAIGGALEGIVVAEIVECSPHPNADKLRVCQVATGDGTTVQIVCGAPNARRGLKAPLATVGAAMPNGMQIKKAALRGVDSFGMLCSAKELGIDADASGLLELPADAPAGKPLAQYLHLPDATIEIKLTPNRPDCLSVQGVARDVAAIFGARAALPAIATLAATTTHERKVELQAGADCPRYCGRLIEGIDADARTPFWMAERLRRSGLRPISLLVDVTNYVLLEMGQPLHAFDAATLVGAIGVRRARAGENLKLLDESEVALDPEFLVITDAADSDRSRPIALAGIMGGYATRVAATTRDVFLEAAHFAPTAISGRARKLGMHTDASHRFERGVDPELPRRALERATQLVVEFGGGRPGPVTEATLPQFLARPAAVPLRRGRLERVLGIAIADAEVARVLAALGMQIEATADGWRATPPSWRFDIAIEEDLIEEVVRIHGYETIPTTMPAGEIRVAAPSETRVDEAALRRQLAARDYREAVNFAFVDAELLKRWQLDAGAIALANPLAADLGTMRTSLLPGLVSALIANRRRQQERVRLFEIGRVFRQGVGAQVETVRIAGVACGQAHELQWAADKRALDFYDVKGDVESLFALSGDARAFHANASATSWLHPGRAADVMRDGIAVGSLGALHPRLLKALDCETDIYVFEFDLDGLVARAVPRGAALARFPSLRRDLSIELPENVNYAAVETAVRVAVGAILREIFVFDRYAGPNLALGLKSVAIGLILQDESRTLTDADADQCVGLAVAALERHCRARLRG
ncbi:MAG: phenylalanine--tRNA ligase subunit beta [Proteobacteria bacterium]|uniref:phenylalanine--tRNA ligase subunit beta n=1 Tax=Rudaea sp. TaxID=2136325 RepID=UPI003784DA8C|nr:phenylalanine--tRNA ligase subunit beta [Pseudomonadota bacterium]